MALDALHLGLAYFLYLYIFFKSKHPGRKLFIKFFCTHFGVIGVWMILIEKPYNMEATTIHIEMDIALFKIRCHSLPYFYLRMQPFNLAPCGISDSLAVNRWRYKQ